MKSDNETEQAVATEKAAKKAYVSRVKITNLKPTWRDLELPGMDNPVGVGFHPEVADVYGIPDGSYETTAATYDYLVGAAASCLTGVLSGMLDGRGVATGSGRLTAEATGTTAWKDRVLVVTAIHVDYRFESGDADPEVIERVHGLHVSRCSMAQSIGGCIDITTAYELV